MGYQKFVGNCWKLGDSSDNDSDQVDCVYNLSESREVNDLSRLIIKEYKP
jgi:hypothetical protein